MEGYLKNVTMILLSETAMFQVWANKSILNTCTVRPEVKFPLDKKFCLDKIMDKIGKQPSLWYCWFTWMEAGHVFRLLKGSEEIWCHVLSGWLNFTL